MHVVIRPVAPRHRVDRVLYLGAVAIGCSISGAGPAVFALAASVTQANDVAEAMRQAFADAGLTATAYVSKISRAGPRIVAQCRPGA